MSQPEKSKISLKEAAARLAGAGTVFYTLPLLMALLVAGTLAQRYIGLYAAQKMFFSSFILWVGPLPLPGGYTVCAVITLSLLLKFLFFSDWGLKKAGIHVTHLGVLILLAGGLMTALQAREGYVTIPENQTSSTVYDYHERELVLQKNDETIGTLSPRQIVKGRPLPFRGYPFSFMVENTCHSCTIIRRQQARHETESPPQGMAKFMALTEGPRGKEDEANIYGATITLSGTGKETDGAYVVFDSMPSPVAFSIGDDSYDLFYTKKQRELPFTLRLEKFVKDVYPGTDMARGYHSDVTVIDGDTTWPVRVEMNKPLRYKGYTFYQSSFTETPYGTATVLAAVRNRGWLFPYIGTILVGIGLILHMILIARGRRDG